MTLQHGVNVNIGNVAATPPVDSPTVIGVVGTGIAGTPTAALYTPVSVHSEEDAVTAFGTTGTLAEACEYIYAVTTVFVVGVRFDETAVDPTEGAAFPSSPTQGDLFRFNADATALSGAVDEGGNTVTTASTGDLFLRGATNWVLQSMDISRNGVIARAIDALETAETATGHKPTILVVPEETYEARNDGAANAIATKLATTAEMLDAIVFADAANSDIPAALAWDTNNGAPRVIGIPQAFTTPEETGLSGAVFFAGQQAALDAAAGSVRESLDNKALSHITSVSPNYTFSYRHASEADRLTTGNGLMVAVRHAGTWRAWGGEVRYGSDDPRQFYATQRVLDNIENHVVDIVVGMIGSGVRAAFVSRAVRAVQDYLDGRVAAGDVTRAVCTPNAALNTAANLAAGRLYLDIDILTTPQARLITLNLQIG